MVALPYCEVRVINLAICWDSSTLVNTFYSENFTSYTQSAGNRNISSSSETTRVKSFNFELFNTKRQSLNLKPIDSNWLSWFIGFTEGGGAILVNRAASTSSSLRFVLTQKEGSILYEIKDLLGFGVVRYHPQGKGNNGFYRFTIANNKDILNLALLFNGNLVIPHRINQLSSWIDLLTEKGLWTYGSSQAQPLIPTLNDSWLSGFTDAEGCFNVNITSRKNTISGYRIRLRFLLDQKNAYNTLINIRNLFGFGRVSIRGETNNVYRYSADSFKGLESIHNYFISFPLKTNKAISFENWCKVFNMFLNKEHLSTEGFNKVREIVKTININNSLNIKTGSAYPSASPSKKNKLIELKD
uniref:LAGLIDADG homing endonuclease n=1 Tax=Porodaedalea chrysoloma TaxID=74615 RepID=UPI0023AA2FAC|nr:LAGLIDADG homing endonuclease [Porodaedalea chrysoloma]WCF76760.1 LAGLIDADG homing endonuclease [Porodaedalea chrysoloma]